MAVKRIRAMPNFKKGNESISSVSPSDGKSELDSPNSKLIDDFENFEIFDEIKESTKSKKEGIKIHLRIMNR